MSERPGAKRDDGGRLVSGSIPEGKAMAARSLLEGAGFQVEVVDDTMWRVGRFRYWPASDMWIGPDPDQQGYGARSLIDRLKASGST